MADRPPPDRVYDRKSSRRSRSRSPGDSVSHGYRERSSRRHHQKRKRSPENTPNIKELPLNSRHLTKHDFKTFKPMFALYLDIQKGKDMEELDDKEVRGRWKSFVGKWNRGELAEGWYDPMALQKAVQSVAERSEDRPLKPPVRTGSFVEEHATVGSDSDDSIGPALPGHEGRSRLGRMGPSIPNVQDLAFKKEMAVEDELDRRETIRYERKVDRKEQRAALDELVPRAEAGTRERQLEKKKEVNEKMKSFREKSPGAAEVPDAELMGGEDGVDSYKKQKEVFERKKNERELRKEEFLRARQAEREERLQEYRTKEEGTMSMLKALAKQNFG